MILLAVLASVGVSTFLRLVKSSIEQIAYAHGIGLLRGFYLRLAPELEPYIVAIREKPIDGDRLAPSSWHTTAGMVAVVNSVVIAAFVGLVLEATGLHWLFVGLAGGGGGGGGGVGLV